MKVQDSITVDRHMQVFSIYMRVSKMINGNKKKMELELRLSLHRYCVYYLNSIKIPASVKFHILALDSGGKNYAWDLLIKL